MAARLGRPDRPSGRGSLICRRGTAPHIFMSAQTQAQTTGLAEKLAALTRPVMEADESLLASAAYDGDRRKAILKLYDQKAGRFWIWEDNTGHRPYCFTRLPMEELSAVRARKDVVEIVEEEKLDLLTDSKARLRKIVTTDPLAIGGGNDSIRDQIKAWEADIKYYENYAYDLGLRMGTYYRVAGGKVVPVKHPAPETVTRSLEEVARRDPKEFQPYLEEWAELLSEPLADFRSQRVGEAPRRRGSEAAGHSSLLRERPRKAGLRPEVGEGDRRAGRRRLRLRCLRK